MIDRLDSLIHPSEIEPFINSLGMRPSKSIRPRLDRAQSTIPFETRPVDWYQQGLRLVDSSIRPGGYLQYAAADYYIQDSGSMLPLAMLGIKTTDWVCDLCAAPGGKASAISEALGPEGMLLANEVIASRLDVLRYTLGRTGRANYVVSNLDSESLAEILPGRFDAVLVDVPCSGQSLIGRQRQTESSFAINHVNHCAARAKRILSNALQLVRPGGRLILSTCTFSIQENEDQVAAFLASYPESVSILPVGNLNHWESPIQPGCYRLWPHRDDCSGAFAAALEIKNQIEPNSIASSQPRSNRSKNIPRKQPSRRQHKAEDLDPFGDFRFERTLDHLLWLGFEPGAMQFLREVGPKIGQGLRIAQIDSGRIEPYHGLSMLTGNLFEPKRAIELDDQQAKNFMLGQSIPSSNLHDLAQSSDTPWCVARWNGKPIGWLKSASNRWNNYLPTWARFSSFSSDSASDSNVQSLE